MSQDHDPVGPFVAAYATTFELLATATGRSRRGPDGTVLAISGAPIAALNAVVSPSLEPNADEIASLAASEDPWELPWTIQMRGAVPDPRVTEVAARYGLTRIGRQPLMIRRPEQGLPAESAADSLRVRAVSADELDLYTNTLADGFEAPRELFRVLADPALAKVDSIAFYLAESDGVPVGTGMTSISGGLTGLFNISTLPQHRRQGYGRAITMELVRAGFAAGADTAYLYASTMGEPVYEAAGFSTEEYLTVIKAQS